MRNQLVLATIIAAGLAAGGYLSRAAAPDAASSAQAPTVTIKDEKARREYSNCSRVTVGPQGEEIVIDLGILSADDAHPDALTMDISTRAYMNASGAKKLELTLRSAIERYEQTFGQIEIDPRKRMKTP